MQSLEPNRKEISKRANEIADWIYDSSPAYDKLIGRLETIMEIFWYKGSTAANNNHLESLRGHASND